MIQNALNFKKELENSSFTLKVIFDMVFTIVILSVALNWLVGLILLQFRLPCPSLAYVLWLSEALPFPEQK